MEYDLNNLKLDWNRAVALVPLGRCSCFIGRDPKISRDSPQCAMGLQLYQFSPPGFLKLLIP